MFSTDKFEIKALENSIFRIEFLQGAEIELSDGVLINETLQAFSKGNKYCILLDATHQFTTTPESRAFVANKSSDRIAFAMVTNSIANRLVGNFFIQFNKPNTPTRLFAEEEAALKWLNEQKELYYSSDK